VWQANWDPVKRAKQSRLAKELKGSPELLMEQREVVDGCSSSFESKSD